MCPAEDLVIPDISPTTEMFLMLSALVTSKPTRSLNCVTVNSSDIDADMVKEI